MIVLSSFSSVHASDTPVEWEDFDDVVNWYPWCNLEWVYGPPNVPRTSETIADLLAHGYEIMGKGLDDPIVSAFMTNALRSCRI